MLETGLARPHELGLGLEVDEQDRIAPASGEADWRLTAVGSLTRGRVWQLTAAPDLRGQVEALADRLVGFLKESRVAPVNAAPDAWRA